MQVERDSVVHPIDGQRRSAVLMAAGHGRRWTGLERARVGIAQLMTQPNTPGPAKFAIAGIGAAVGLAMSKKLEQELASPQKAEELDAQGISVLSSQQAQVYAMAMPFGAAAGISLGLQRRAPTAGFTTASQVAAAALLSTVAGAVINASSPRAGDYVTGIGLMSAVTGAGILAGIRDEVAMGGARMAGLGLFGVALGVAAPMLIEHVTKVPGQFQRSLQHAES